MLSHSILPKVARVAGVTLESPLGRGGQGVVWRVLRREAGGRPMRPMALKVCERRTPGQRQAFEHEAYVGAKARGQGLVGAEAVFRGPCWGALLQPWVDGISLAVLLRLWGDGGRALGGAAATVLLHDLGLALTPVHALGDAGWVHGDVTPHNVLVDRVGRVWLLDLGAAHPAGRPAARIVGHVGYMAPEQAAGDTLVPATDAYGVGRIVTEALRAAPHDGPSDALREAATALMVAVPAERPTLDALVRRVDKARVDAGRLALAHAVRSCIGNERASVEVRPQALRRARAWKTEARRASWVASYRWLSAAAGLGVVVGSWLRLVGAA